MFNDYQRSSKENISSARGSNMQRTKMDGSKKIQCHDIAFRARNHLLSCRLEKS
jgi:hypothetical protein